MSERLHAGPAAESEAPPLIPAAPGRAAAGTAATLLGLQRTAGNAAADAARRRGVEAPVLAWQHEAVSEPVTLTVPG